MERAQKYLEEMTLCLQEKIKQLEAIIVLANHLTEDTHSVLNHEIVSSIVEREKHIFILDQEFLSQRKHFLQYLGIDSFDGLSIEMKREFRGLEVLKELVSRVMALSDVYTKAKEKTQTYSNQIRKLDNSVKKAHQIKLAYKKTEKKL